MLFYVRASHPFKLKERRVSRKACFPFANKFYVNLYTMSRAWRLAQFRRTAYEIKDSRGRYRGGGPSVICYRRNTVSPFSFLPLIYMFIKRNAAPHLSSSCVSTFLGRNPTFILETYCGR